MALISLMEYAKKHNRDSRNIRRRAENGKFQTAKKIGNMWVIEEDEPLVDERVKSGKFKNFRKSPL